MRPSSWPEWDGWVDEKLLARLRARDEAEAVTRSPVPEDDAWPDFEAFAGVVLAAGEDAAATVVRMFSAVRG